MRFAGRFTLSGEACGVFFNGTDSPWLHIGTAVGDFIGPVPEDGKGMGYQFEASLSYQVAHYGIFRRLRPGKSKVRSPSNRQGNLSGTAARERRLGEQVMPELRGIPCASQYPGETVKSGA